MAVPRSYPLHRYPAQRIALVKPSALGDVVHALPVLTALRRRYPQAYICWVINRGYADLVRGHPDLDDVLPFDRGLIKNELLQAALGYGEFFRKLRSLKFDLVVDLQGLFRSGLMSLATGAPRRVGLQTAREGAAWFYTDILTVGDAANTHAVDRYWLAAEALGVGGLAKTFHVPVPDEARSWASEALRAHSRPWLMTAVGSRWQTKRWPTEHFATLLRKAQERFGGTAVFVGGPEESDAARLTARRLHGTYLDLTGQTTLPKLAAVLARADAMVANDTGPLHLAAALGRPTIAPYTCTRVRRTGPYNQSGAVESRVWCQGSYLKTCDRLDCMTELTPFRLWGGLHEVLREWELRRQSA